MQSTLADFIGGWRCEETGMFFIDATAHVRSLKQALIVGRHFSQKAVYDIAGQEVVYL